MYCSLADCICDLAAPARRARACYLDNNTIGALGNATAKHTHTHETLPPASLTYHHS